MSHKEVNLLRRGHLFFEDTSVLKSPKIYVSELLIEPLDNIIDSTYLKNLSVLVVCKQPHKKLALFWVAEYQ